MHTSRNFCKGFFVKPGHPAGVFVLVGLGVRVGGDTVGEPPGVGEPNGEAVGDKVLVEEGVGETIIAVKKAGDERLHVEPVFGSVNIICTNTT